MPPPKGRPDRPGGRRWARLVALVVARDHGKCWVCCHWAAHSADHVIPVTEDPSREWDLTNLKAVHSWPRGCPDCTIAAGKPVYCNQLKSMGSVERARRIISERTGLDLSGDTPRAPEGREF